MKNTSDNCDMCIPQTYRRTNDENYGGYHLTIILYLCRVDYDRKIYIEILN